MTVLRFPQLLERIACLILDKQTLRTIEIINVQFPLDFFIFSFIYIHIFLATVKSCKQILGDWGKRKTEYLRSKFHFNSIINFLNSIWGRFPNHLQNGDREEIAPETIWVGILRLLKNAFNTSYISNYLFNDLMTFKSKYVTCPCEILKHSLFSFKLILSIFNKMH